MWICFYFSHPPYYVFTHATAAGVYEVKIEVWDVKVGRWVPKTNNGGISTMFPKSWDGVRIKNEVEHAFANKTIGAVLDN